MERSNITNITIVGAGTMGSRIAAQCLLSGKQVHLYDKFPEALRAAIHTILNWISERVNSVEVNEFMSRLSPDYDLSESLRSAHLVIEAVPEDLKIKRQVFSEIDQSAPSDAIIATNSSSIPSSRIADVTGRPEKVLSMNFTDPMSGGRLVEVMGNDHTQSTIVDDAVDFVRSIGMVPIVTRKEIGGFAFNRVWRAVKREALHLVADGYADFEDIDRAWILLFGSPWGPFGLMDRIGLDVVRDIELQYYHASQSERDRPPSFLERFMAQNRLGVKSGHGFYKYPDPKYQQPGWLSKEPPWSSSDTLNL